MADRIDVYVDYISPYAYFGWRNVRRLAKERGLEIDVHPVVFAAMLSHWGHLGPAEIPPKREWTFKHVARYAAVNGIPLRGPKSHPFRSLLPLRVTVAHEDDRLAIVDALFDAIWAEGIDGQSEEETAAALDRRGFDGAALVEKTKDPAIKNRLKEITAAAIGRGVFGVPTFAVKDELFWGNDSLDHVALVLDGKDPLDPKLVEQILARPAGVHRPR